MGDGELTERELMWSAGELGESGAKLELEDGGLECSTFMCLSSKEKSDIMVGVETEPIWSEREEDDELFRVCVLKCLVICVTRNEFDKLLY